jgi:hypothetical protein
MSISLTDERLMAYADGEATPEERAEIERALAEDASLRARVALFEKSRAVFAGAADRGRVAVPDALVAKVRALGIAHEAARSAAAAAPERVVDLAARRKAKPVFALPAALAAAIALAVGVTGGLLVGGRTGAPEGDLAFAALNDPAIHEALDRLPSGSREDLPSGSAVAAISSFEREAGQLCREFEYDGAGGNTVVAVACSAEAGWDMRFAIAAASAEDTGYAPASSLEALDAYLGIIEAGAPLSAEAEAAALQALR